MPKRQSKLNIVRNALENRAKEDIIISNIEEKENFDNEQCGAWNHLVMYWIAPKEGIYLAKELQKLMLGLVPKLKPYNKHSFTQSLSNSSEYFLSIGSIYYQEGIGKREKVTKSVLTLTDEEILNEYGFTNGKKIINAPSAIPLIRLVGIKLLPNKELAKEAYLRRDGPDYNIETKRVNKQYHIHLNDIKKYCPDIKKRLKRLDKNN